MTAPADEADAENGEIASRLNYRGQFFVVISHSFSYKSEDEGCGVDYAGAKTLLVVVSVLNISLLR